MRKSTKVLLIALVALVALTATVVGVMAAETSTAIVYGETVDVKDKTTFDVGFSFKENNTEVECGKITLTWDSNLMEATAIKADEALAGAKVETKIEEGKAIVAWAGSAIADNKAEGDLFTVSFDNKGVEGMAAINVAVDSFGYTAAFVAHDVAASVTANAAYAQEGSELVYDDSSVDPVKFINDALKTAEETGADIKIKLEANMTFTADATIGTAGATHNGSVTIYGDLTTTEQDVTDAETGEVTGTKTVTTADNTVTIYCDVILLIYGNVNFTDINLNNTTKSYDGTANQSWSTGGAFVYVEGKGIFGHDETTEGAGDFGFISSSKSVHLSGHVEAYNGGYWTITGNFYKTGVDIKDPSVKLAGKARCNYLFGGLHNGGANTTVSGTATVEVSGNYAYVSSRMVCGNYYTSATPIATNVYINVPNNSIAELYFGSYVSGTNVTYNADNKISVVIDGMIAPTSSTPRVAAHKAQAGTAKNMNLEVTINGGSFRSPVYFGIDGYAITNSMAFTNSNIVVNINGGTFQKKVYGGSFLTESGNSTKVGKTMFERDNIRNITITGGEFWDILYGGSNIAGSDGSSQRQSKGVEAKTTLTIKGGKFSGIYAGSYLDNETAYDAVETELIIQPAEGKTITRAFHIGAGGEINVTGAEFKAASTLYIKDVYTAADAAYGVTAANFVNDWDWHKTDNQNTGYIMGGSQINKNGIHSGDSKVVLQRCLLGTGEYFGGSRLDGVTAVHSGTSTLVIDGNTGLVDGVETVGTNGWFYSYATFYGGSLLNGWWDSKTPTSDSNQTGASFVELIGPEDGTTTAPHTLRLNGPKSGYSTYIYGGSKFASKMTTPQRNHSTVTIKNYVNATNNFMLFGGSSYSNRYFTRAADDTFVSSSKVIVEGTYTGTVVAGVNTTVNTEGQTAQYYHDSAVILKGGSLTKSPYPNSWLNTSSYPNGAAYQNGKVLYEVYGESATDGKAFNVSWLGKFGATNRTFKLIGNFSTADGMYNVITNLTGWRLDLVQATGSNLTLQKSDGTKAYSTSIDRINDGRQILFVDSTSTKDSYKEIQVDPTMTFADLLATSGLKIVNVYNATTKTVYNYSDIIFVDHISTSPNGFALYSVKEDGTADKELTNIPASADAQYRLKCGSTYTKAATFGNHVFKISNKTVLLESSLTMVYKILPELLETYGYTDPYIVVDFANKETKVDTYTLDNKGKLQFAFSNIAPQGIASPTKVTLYATYNGETASAVELNYGIYEFCYEALPTYAAVPAYAKYCPLIVDLLNYGAAAQVFTNFNTERLANAELTAEQAALATTDEALGYDALQNIRNYNYETIDNPTVTVSTTLVVQNSIMIKYTLTGLDTTENVVLKLKNLTTGTEWEAAVEVVDGKYVAMVDELNAHQVSNQIIATVYKDGVAVSNTCLYSIESYVAAARDAAAAYPNVQTYTDLEPLTKAMMKYGKSALNCK